MSLPDLDLLLFAGTRDRMPCKFIPAHFEAHHTGSLDAGARIPLAGATPVEGETCPRRAGETNGAAWIRQGRTYVHPESGVLT